MRRHDKANLRRQQRLARSKRQPHLKGWGFDYLGAEIWRTGAGQNLQSVPPPEELASEETIKSFRLTPFIVDHEMLGKTPHRQRKKGIQGVIGENVYYDHPVFAREYQKSFSDAALSDISSGKLTFHRYRSRYDFGNPACTRGRHTEVVQRHLRGNPPCIVDEGAPAPTWLCRIILLL